MENFIIPKYYVYFVWTNQEINMLMMMICFLFSIHWSLSIKKQVVMV